MRARTFIGRLFAILSVLIFLHPVHGAKAAEPKKIIIYSHGQTDSTKSEGCFLNGPPATLRKAAEASGYTFSPFCEDAVEKDGDARGSYIYKRVAQVTAEVERLVKLGYQRRNIVLAGHSAGAWTSLMAMSKTKGLARSVIAFSPACCGKDKDSDHRDWESVREKQIKDMLSGFSFQALTFAYEDDPYDPTPQLRFLDARGRVISSNCHHGHRTYRNDCNAARTVEQIKDFLK